MSVTQAFFSEVVRLHEIPNSIVSDRDPVFTSAFWTELFRLAGVQLKLSSAFHPQTDGQSEAANRVIGMYLRCLTGDRPRHWLRWLPWAKYCFNTAYQTSLRMTPFQVVYGRPPPTLHSYDRGSARVPAVDQALLDRDEFFTEIRERLLQAQDYAKLYYDNKHRDMAFAVGAWVWVRLLHCQAASLPGLQKGKLAPRFYGPYKVLERIGDVAYRLELPKGACIHDVFHVGVLKQFHGEPPSQVPALPTLTYGRVLPMPVKAIHGRLARGVREVLIQWDGKPAADATWENVDDFARRYPTFQLEDELNPKEGRDVMVGIVYERRRGQKQSTAREAGAAGES